MSGDAFPAVIVPPSDLGWNDGLRPASFAIVVPGRTLSSRSSSVPGTRTTRSSYHPSSHARAARSCEPAANSSWRLRDTPNLSATGIGWSDIAAVELNEAFAVQSLVCIDQWGIDSDLVNTKGGAIALGHPLGASGGRVLGTLAKRLVESGDRWGVAAICIGVGQGLAVVLENVSAGVR